MSNIEQHNIEREAGAAYWAEQRGATSLYRDLRTGDRFTFAGKAGVCTKKEGRRYVGDDGRQYVTGAYVGVCRLP